MLAQVLVYGESQANAICEHLNRAQEQGGQAGAAFHFCDVNAPDAARAMLARLDEMDALVLQVSLDGPLTQRAAIGAMRKMRTKKLVVIPIAASTMFWPLDGFDPGLAANPPRLRGDTFLRDYLQGGGDPEKAAEAYLAADIAGIVDLDARRSSEIEAWRELDGLTDVPLAGLIEANLRSVRLFHSVFAPTNLILRQIVDGLIRSFGLSDETARASAKIFEAGEIMGPEYPVHPGVIAHYGLEWAVLPGAPDQRALFADWVGHYVRSHAGAAPPPAAEPAPPPSATREEAGLLLKIADLKINPVDTPSRAFLQACARNFDASKAQLFQDVFVLQTLGWRRDGFFVEFGATDGLGISNTYMLEKGYGWRGILAEPFPFWHEQLGRNRSCIIDHRCVWSVTGERLEFSGAEEFPEYATIASYKGADIHKELRERSGASFEVETVSLNDLLREHGAPRNLDYLSVDTEGSEFEILRGLDFSAYLPKVITVEHNYNEAQREQIRLHLAGAGYSRRMEELSQWDDWYVHEG